MKPETLNTARDWYKAWVQQIPGCGCLLMSSGLEGPYQWATCPEHNPEARPQGWIRILKLDPHMNMVEETQAAARAYARIAKKEFL